MNSNLEHERSRETQPRDRNVFRFLDLPGEIRNMIYSLALEYSDSISIRRTHTPSARSDVKSVNVSVLRVCRQISQEAVLSFYLNNTFRFSLLRRVFTINDPYIQASFFTRIVSQPKVCVTIEEHSYRWRLQTGHPPDPGSEHPLRSTCDVRS